MEYEVIYSDRRTLALTVKDGRLIVRAPRGTTEKRIRAAVESHIEWATRHIEKQRHRSQVQGALTEEQIKELRRRARSVLTAKTEELAAVMGVRYNKITITSAKTRFGSCNSKGNISYSYRLMLYPEAAQDYVVVHELAHLVEMNHSPRFYAIVARYLPDYKQRAALLKK